MSQDEDVRALQRELAAHGPDPDVLRALRERADAAGVIQRRDPVWVRFAPYSSKKGGAARVGPYSAVIIGQRSGIVTPDGRDVGAAVEGGWLRPGPTSKGDVVYGFVTVSARPPEGRDARLVQAVSSGKLEYLGQLERILERRVEASRTDVQEAEWPRLWVRAGDTDDEFRGAADGPFLTLQVDRSGLVNVEEIDAKTGRSRGETDYADDDENQGSWHFLSGRWGGSEFDLIHVSTRP